MNRLDGRTVLTAAAMREAEAPAISRIGAEALMAKAGNMVGEAIERLVGTSEILVVCGPGNNGGDGYIAAGTLRDRGAHVRVAAMAAPASETARWAKEQWGGAVESLVQTGPAPVVVDALFGIGLCRPIDDRIMASWHQLAGDARFKIAIDLPSGLGTDDGRVFSTPPRMDVTLALGAAKPAHLLQPAARYCGAVRLLDIGLDVGGDMHVLEPPALPEPSSASHKFNRGMVAVVSGAMAGASLLSATAAMHAGAGYVILIGGSGGGPHALVHREFTDQSLDDERIGAMVIGPGLGRDDAARNYLERVLDSRHPLIIDGDALHLLIDRLPKLAACSRPVILTPHAGEFAALFGQGEGSKIQRTRAAADRAGAIVVHKGPDTVIAAPDGRVALAEDANDWLSTAGSGDALTGAIAASLAALLDPFAAASAGVWMHGQAARRLGAAFIADELAVSLSAVRAAL